MFHPTAIDSDSEFNVMAFFAIFHRCGHVPTDRHERQRDVGNFHGVSIFVADGKTTGNLHSIHPKNLEIVQNVFQYHASSIKCHE